MMLYTYVKDAGGNVQRVGAECSVPEELGAVLKSYSEDGCQMADASEHDQQVIGAVNKQLEAANEKIAELEGKTTDKEATV